MAHKNSRVIKQSYKYYKNQSILGNAKDEYELTKEDYYKLYSFFVTYSMCGTQSLKKRTFVDYGWPDNNIVNTTLGSKLSSVLNLNRNPDFIFTTKNDLKEQFISHQLTDGELMNVDRERAVIGITSEKNNYLKLFYRIRDGLAHGKYRLVYSSSEERMIIIQDDNGHNVTARIVIKLSTLLNFIDFIDIKGLYQ